MEIKRATPRERTAITAADESIKFMRQKRKNAQTY
jgi:hypothetical protein